MFDKENKYIVNDCNFFREKMQDGAIITYHVMSIRQLTDSFSEAFSHPFYISVHDEFDAIDIHKPNVYKVGHEIIKMQSERYLKWNNNAKPS